MAESLKIIIELLRDKNVQGPAFLYCCIIIILGRCGLDDLPLRRVAQEYMDLWAAVGILLGVALLWPVLLRLVNLPAKRCRDKAAYRYLQSLAEDEKELLRGWVNRGLVSGRLEVGHYTVAKLLAAGVLHRTEDGKKFHAGVRVAEVEIAPHLREHMYSAAGRELLGAEKEAHFKFVEY